MQDKRDELRAMDENFGRFGIEHRNADDLSRVVDLTLDPGDSRRLLSDWMEHEAALKLRDDYYAGRRQPSP